MTLRKRLLEFSNTASSQLTLEQFETMDVELITNSKALIAQENAEARAKDPLAEIKADPFGMEQDPPAFTRNRVREREEKNILAHKLKQQQSKELLLKELELDTQPKLNARLMPGGGKSATGAAAAAAAGGQQLLLPAGSEESSARDLEIQQIQSESRLLLESQPGVSDSIVHQIEELMGQKAGFALLDEGPQREVSSLGKDSAHVHVTPMNAPLHGAATAAASSSSAAAAASPATAAAAVPTPVKERLKSIHKGPNLSSSRSRRGGGAAGAAGGPGQPPSTPLQKQSILMGKDAPPFDLASILPPPPLPGSAAAAAHADMVAMQQFASVGNPLADAMLVASDPSLHLSSTCSVAGVAAAVASSSSAAAAAAAAGVHVSVSAYLAATPVDPDLNNWSDLAELDDEIESSVLLSAEEVAFKTAAWEQIHRDYLAEQEEKKQMAAQLGAGAPLGPDGLPLPRRQYKKKPKGGAPAATAAEATMRLLAEKKYSDKINYNALKGLLSNEIDKPKIDEEDEEDDEEEEDEEEEEEAEEETAGVGSKRGVSSISAQLPSAKQQRRASPTPSKPAAADDDDADDAAEDGADDDDDEPTQRARGNDDDEPAEEEDYE